MANPNQCYILDNFVLLITDFILFWLKFKLKKKLTINESKKNKRKDTVAERMYVCMDPLL